MNAKDAKAENARDESARRSHFAMNKTQGGRHLVFALQHRNCHVEIAL
jgi:hypothetical protein